jgi:hypothetical protein
MIPRAVQQVFRVAEELKSNGWEYKMEGQFLEIVRQTLQSPIPVHYSQTLHTHQTVQRNHQRAAR